MATATLRTAMIGALVLLTGLLAAGGGRARAQDATPTAGDLAVAIHAGTCAEPIAEPVHDLGAALPYGADEESGELEGEVRGTAPTEPVLRAEGTIGATYGDLLDAPHALAVHEGGQAAGPMLACGDLGGLVDEGRLAVGLRPVGGSGLAGVALLDEDTEGALGIGEDEVRVTVYLVGNVAAAPGEAVAPGGVSGSAVEVSLTEFAIEMPAELPAGPTTFVVTNAGEVEHNFEVEGEGVEESFGENLPPGETRELEVELEPGTYEVYCPVADHDEAGMRLELTVTE